jgi:hypothetical protein
MKTTREEKLKEKIKELRKECNKYINGYNILYEYYDSISDEEKPKVDKQLTKLGL